MKHKWIAAIVTLAMMVVFSGCVNSGTKTETTTKKSDVQTKPYTFPTKTIQTVNDQKHEIDQLKEYIEKNVKVGDTKEEITEVLGYGAIQVIDIPSRYVTKYTLSYDTTLEPYGIGVDLAGFRDKKIGLEILFYWTGDPMTVDYYELYYVNPVKEKDSKLADEIMMNTHYAKVVKKEKLDMNVWYPRQNPKSITAMSGYGGVASMFNEKEGYAYFEGDGAGIGNISYTNDGGIHWEVVSKYQPFAKLEKASDLSFIDRNRGWILNIPYSDGKNPYMIYHTEDGGKTWTERLVPKIPRKDIGIDYSTLKYFRQLKMSFFNEKDGILLMDSTDGREFKMMWIYVTSDGGVTWSNPQAVYPGWLNEGRIDAISWDFSKQDKYQFKVNNDDYMYVNRDSAQGLESFWIKKTLVSMQ